MTHHIQNPTSHSPRKPAVSAGARGTLQPDISRPRPSATSQVTCAPPVAPTQRIRQKFLTNSAEKCFATAVCALARIKGHPHPSRAIGGRPRRRRMEQPQIAEPKYTLAAASRHRCWHGFINTVRGAVTNRGSRSSTISMPRTRCSSSAPARFVSRSIRLLVRRSAFVTWALATYSANMLPSMVNPAVLALRRGPAASSPR